MQPSNTTTLPNTIVHNDHDVGTQDWDIIDLHLDTLIPQRLWGYNPLKAHRFQPFGRHFFGHSDVPRLQEVGVTGGMWSITTNPFRLSNSRWAVFCRNLQTLEKLGQSNKTAIVTSFEEYQHAKMNRQHAIFPSIQGANAISGAPDGLLSLPDPYNSIIRMTLIHLTPSVYGNTSSPFHHLHQNKGLTDAGKNLIEAMNHHRIFVDLAHAHPQTFWDALQVHNPTHPILVTHTGVQGITAHWRNLDDAQIKAIAQSGGVIGIMFANNFLKHHHKKDASIIIDHLEYLIQVGGEDIAALGSDFDGAISAPTDLKSMAEFPRLIQLMQERKWSPERIQKILGQNFLRVLKEYRPNKINPEHSSLQISD